MAINRLSNRFRVREDLTDSITPNVFVQDNVAVPHGEWKPAEWLPIVFTKTNTQAGEDAFVISSGKVVALDSENRVVPAGLRAALVDTFASATIVLTYDSDDFDYQVTDLVTGSAVASSAGATYTAAQIATALLDRGLVPASAMVTSGGTHVTADADVQEVIEYFISEPVGVTVMDVFVFAGRPEDGNQRFTNYNKQHLIQFVTEIQMKVPHRTLGSDTTSFNAGTIVTKTVQANDGRLPAPGEVWEETALDDVKRWAAAVDGKSVVALQLDNDFIAKNTTRTAISCDTSGILTTEKTAIGLIRQAGDFYVDTRTGTIFIHEDAWDTQVTGSVTFVITYYYYAVAGAGGAASDRFVFFDGVARPGAFVSYDLHSNFVEMGSAQDALGTSNTRSIGRLLNVDVEPKDLLDKVKTAWNLTGLSAVSQMPGTATGGYSDLITLATSEEVADQIAIINLKVS
jgi:hypothetical protein